MERDCEPYRSWCLWCFGGVENPLTVEYQFCAKTEFKVAAPICVKAAATKLSEGELLELASMCGC